MTATASNLLDLTNQLRTLCAMAEHEGIDPAKVAVSFEVEEAPSDAKCVELGKVYVLVDLVID